MPFSVSISNALELLISDVVVGIGVWSKSVDTLLSRNGVGWLVNEDSVGLGGDESNNG